MIKKRLGRREASPHLNIAGEADNRAGEGDAHLSLGIAYDSHSHLGSGIRTSPSTENYPAQTKVRDDTVSSAMIPEEIETLIKKLRDEVYV